MPLIFIFFKKGGEQKMKKISLLLVALLFVFAISTSTLADTSSSGNQAVDTNLVPALEMTAPSATTLDTLQVDGDNEFLLGNLVVSSNAPYTIKYHVDKTHMTKYAGTDYTTATALINVMSLIGGDVGDFATVATTDQNLKTNCTVENGATWSISGHQVVDYADKVLTDGAYHLVITYTAVQN